MNESIQRLLRQLPSVDKLLQHEEIEQLAAGVPRGVVVQAIQAAIDRRRELLSDSAALGAESGPGRDDKGDVVDDAGDMCQSIVDEVKVAVAAVVKPHYRRVVNATGIILHTALGRAVLAESAMQQIQRELAGYSLLQMDTETAKRCNRDGRVEYLLGKLTGAPAGTVVNNNAAATAIVLNTVAAGREVIVSRGQLIEIGGSFRLPEVMALSGVKMVEVGTTNKTHLRDYENAIGENTAAILRVHPSNYRITGFTSEVPLGELVKLAHDNALTLIDDVGAGALIDFSRFGFDYEPTLGDSIRAGADVVTSSADKLIGAAQGGIILGREDIVKAIRRNPWARIVRVDKLTLGAIEATLMLFLDEARALGEVPTLAMLNRRQKEMRRQAQGIADVVNKGGCGVTATVVDGFSKMGSGSLPEQKLPTSLVAVVSERFGANRLASELRKWEPPIIARIQDDRVLIDVRTLLSDDCEIVMQAILGIHS